MGGELRRAERSFRAEPRVRRRGTAPSGGGYRRARTARIGLGPDRRPAVGGGKVYE